MNARVLPLLGTRRFLPLFVTQFLGAANDNLFKNAIGILIVYRLLAADPAQARILVTAAAGIFILPYLLFSSLAGELADRLEKTRLVRIVKSCEVAIMAIGSAGLYLGDPYLLLGVLFLLGIHSTFFGPLKYSILPQYLAPDELLGGNALIEGGTFLAILIGTIVGGLSILAPGGLALTSILLLAVAISGLAASLALPQAPANQPDLRIDWNLPRATRDVLRTVTRHRELNLAVIGISWFWAVGAVYLGQLPALAKEILSADQQVVTLMLAMFSIGIGAGSLACARLLRGEISARYVPLAALGMALLSLDLRYASAAAARSGAEIGVGAFIASASGLHLLIALFLIAACGGMFTVPLYAILQARSDPSERARAIAANNVMNAIYMVAATLVAVALLKAGVGVLGLFVAGAIGNALVSVAAFAALPEAALRRTLVAAFPGRRR